MRNFITCGLKTDLEEWETVERIDWLGIVNLVINRSVL